MREWWHLLNSGGFSETKASEADDCGHHSFFYPCTHSGCTHTRAISCPVLRCLTLTQAKSPTPMAYARHNAVIKTVAYTCLQQNENIANTLFFRTVRPDLLVVKSRFSILIYLQDRLLTFPIYQFLLNYRILLVCPNI